jgi:cytoplasmic iron level regulating protein YaaA (DUF328/UPF0246 family)
VLSGLYGSVRPFDLIQPYRLCMGLKPPLDGVDCCGDGGGSGAATANGTSLPPAKDLYDLWGRVGLTNALAAEFLAPTDTKKDSARPFVVNVASQEYCKVRELWPLF